MSYECTQEERELLDAIKSGKDIPKARAAVAFASRPKELFEAAVAAYFARDDAAQACSRAMDEWLAAGYPHDGSGPVFEALWDSVENEWRKRKQAMAKAERERLGLEGSVEARPQ